MVLEISPNLQESTCAIMSLGKVFFLDFCEISNNTFFTEHLPVTAFIRKLALFQYFLTPLSYSSNLVTNDLLIEAFKTNFKSSRHKVFYKISVLKIFSIFTVKHLDLVLFFNKAASWKHQWKIFLLYCTSNKKEKESRYYKRFLFEQ